jgi:hypothetical protein
MQVHQEMPLLQSSLLSLKGQYLQVLRLGVGS